MRQVGGSAVGPGGSVARPAAAGPSVAGPSVAGSSVTGPAVADPRPVLVYDGDCGLCERFARLARVLARGRYDVRPWQRMDLAKAGLTVGECETAAQWVGPGHEPVAGHRAIAAALKEGPWWCRPAGSLLGERALARPAEATYRWVASHRHRLPGSSASCRRPSG